MSQESEIIRPKVQWIEITEEAAGQRLDNFLLARLKGVPKSRIYRIVRKGEVRINKGRCQAKQRLVTGDIVRIPPVRTAQRDQQSFVPPKLEKHLRQNILFEDEFMLIINKPSGFAVHGGSGISSGIIEALRCLRPEAKFLELVHRLDKGTSGCLLLAKKRSALTHLHELFRTDRVQKSYLALLSGQWQRKKMWVTEPLQKNVQKGGERMVVVNQAGKTAETFIKRLQKFEYATLVEVSPKTGRTHQIRVHTAWLGHPIVGDDRYGDSDTNSFFKSKGYKRLFLHAEKLELEHPETGQIISIIAPRPEDFSDFQNDSKKPQLNLSMKNRFDLIIFDWDGTLVNSIDWIVYCIQTAAEENGCAIPEQQDTKDIIGLSIKKAMQKLFPGIDEGTQQQLVKRYSELFFSKTITQSDLFADVYLMLQDLKRAGYQLAVATGKNRVGLDRALLGTRTAELFAITKCADETMSKPNPTMLNEIVEQLAVSKQRTLMVGDSIHDLQMATNAEIASVGVACGAHSESTLKQFNPLHCLQQTHELFELL